MLCSWDGGSCWWHLPKGRSLKPKMEDAGSFCFFLRAREDELCWSSAQLILSCVLWILGFMFSECISFCNPKSSVKSCWNRLVSFLLVVEQGGEISPFLGKAMLHGLDVVQGEAARKGVFFRNGVGSSWPSFFFPSWESVSSVKI